MALGVNSYDETAIARVYDIKGRPPNKPLTLFVTEPADWRRYGRPDTAGVASELIEAFWPGPLFLILEATAQVPHERVQLEGTVSIGCIGNSTWREMMGYLDDPLAMTSANRSGTVDDDTLIDLDLACDQVGDRVDLIIAEDPPSEATQATTIVDIVNGPCLYREGDLTATELNEIVDVF
jgi:L-threonylcarbamoyladenylate synthase